MPISANFFTNAFNSSFNRVGEGLMELNATPMRPISVATPIRLTSNTPLPCTTKVPEKT
ncbi:MAG: hypothetical protein BWY72_02126 [Bacteroidetes bacterium ADurb.Bin416]|nr:MAG: hypothetical protein BWY72_02126 [Bacteroidetes bacterium ADurb.Bin416]